MLALLAALMLPPWSAALQPNAGRGEPGIAPPGRFLPGADVGVSPHATWEGDRDGGHVNLVGVAGARLVVDEALILRVDRAASRLELHAQAEGVEGVGEFFLIIHKEDAEVGRLPLTRSPALLDLGGVRTGEEFRVGAVLAIPSGSSEGGRVFVRIWIAETSDQTS